MNKLLILVMSFFFLSCKEEVRIEQSKQEEVVLKKSKGSLECIESSFNAGKIKKGKAVKHTFIFKNTGEEPVIIVEKKLSCNCTNIKTSTDTIQPDQISNFELIIDTKDKDVGKHEATATIKTNGQRKFYLLEVFFEIVN